MATIEVSLLLPNIDPGRTSASIPGLPGTWQNQGSTGRATQSFKVEELTIDLQEAFLQYDPRYSVIVEIFEKTGTYVPRQTYLLRGKEGEIELRFIQCNEARGCDCYAAVSNDLETLTEVLRENDIPSVLSKHVGHPLTASQPRDPERTVQ